MQRPLSIFLSTFVILGLFQLDCQLLAQSPEEFTNSIGMKFVLIPKGTFTMGSPTSEKERNTNERQHQVTISKEYYLGVTEVTQEQYKRVIGINLSNFQDDKVEGSSLNHPVDGVSWAEAIAFSKNLSELPAEKNAGRVYRLPTEAEWEYACRAGSKSAYCFAESSKSLGDYAWSLSNSNNRTHSVGEKKANAWGLHDMHGNVWEWCSDFYGDYPVGSVNDPTGPREGSYRVFRGGSWELGAAVCRSASRSWNTPLLQYHAIGFRLAMNLSETP